MYMKHCMKMPVCQNWKDLWGNEGGQEMLTTHTTWWESGRWKWPKAKSVVSRVHEFLCRDAKPWVRAVAGAKGWCWRRRCFAPPVLSLPPCGRDPTTALTSSKKCLSEVVRPGLCGAGLAGIRCLRLIVATSLSSRDFGQPSGQCLPLGAWIRKHQVPGECGRGQTGVVREHRASLRSAVIKVSEFLVNL